MHEESLWWMSLTSSSGVWVNDWGRGFLLRWYTAVVHVHVGPYFNTLNIPRVEHGEHWHVTVTHYVTMTNCGHNHDHDNHIFQASGAKAGGNPPFPSYMIIVCEMHDQAHSVLGELTIPALQACRYSSWNNPLGSNLPVWVVSPQLTMVPEVL